MSPPKVKFMVILTRGYFSSCNLARVGGSVETALASRARLAARVRTRPWKCRSGVNHRRSTTPLVLSSRPAQAIPLVFQTLSLAQTARYAYACFILLFHCRGIVLSDKLLMIFAPFLCVYVHIFISFFVDDFLIWVFCFGTIRNQISWNCACISRSALFRTGLDYLFRQAISSR